MRMVIVTGMSGAGKSTALKVLEDTGYFCVDNLPIPLFLKFVEMSAQPDACLLYTSPSTQNWKRTEIQKVK